MCSSDLAFALLQGANIRLEFLDLLTPRNAARVVGRQLLTPALQGRGEALGAGFVADSLALRLLDLIVQDHQVARASLYLLLEAIHLCAQRISTVQPLHSGLGAHDGVEEDDRPESTTDAIEE